MRNKQIQSRSTETNPGILTLIFSNPVFMIFVPYSLSFLAWIVPEDWYGRHWRTAESQIDVYGWLFLITWLGLIAVVALFGASIGKKFVPYEAPAKYDRNFELWYYIISAGAAIGVSYVIFQVARTYGISFIVKSITTSAANEIHDALYENYSAGLASLRYLTILAGGSAIFLLFKKNYKNLVWLHAINVFLLIISSLISSRLSLIAAGVVLLVCIAKDGKGINFRALLIAALVGFTVLTVANSTRNANFYANSGIKNPVMASFAEALTYLGSPFQGTLSAAQRVASGSSDMSTGVSRELTTNSALDDVSKRFGNLATCVIIPPVIFIASFLYLVSFRSSAFGLAAGAGAWGYAFCEIWRIFLFGQGVFWTLFAFGLILPHGLVIARILLRQRRNASAPPARRRSRPNVEPPGSQPPGQ